MDQAERVAFCGLGIMGGPMAANLARAGFDLSVWTHSEGKAERFAAEHGVRAAATPAEAAEGASAVDDDGGGRAGGGGGAAGRGRRRGRARAGRAVPGHVHDRPQRGARRSAKQLDERDLASWRGRSPARGPRPRTARSRSWSAASPTTFERARPLLEAMGELIVLVGPAGPRPDGQGDHQHARRGERRRAGRGRASGPARPGSTPTASSRWPARAPAARRCSTLKGRPMLEDELRAAVQARAHAQGRAPLPGRGARRSGWT